MDIQYYIRASGSEHLYSKKLEDLPDGSKTFDEVSKMLSSEPKTLLPQPPGVLEWSYQDGYAVVVLDRDVQNLLIGYTRLMQLIAKSGDQPAWYELGSTWVHPNYRGNGITKQMYKLLLPNHADANILATTTSSFAIHVGEQLGFVPVSRKTLPAVVWKSSCTCPRTKTKSLDNENRGCILARGEAQREGDEVCWFRVTPETNKRLQY